MKLTVSVFPFRFHCIKLMVKDTVFTNVCMLVQTVTVGTQHKIELLLLILQMQNVKGIKAAKNGGQMVIFSNS